MSELADEGTVEDERDDVNGMLAASLPSTAALSSGYNPAAQNPVKR